MENRRFILIALMVVVIFFLYQSWQDDYGNKPMIASNPTPALDIPEEAMSVPDSDEDVTAVLPRGDAPLALRASGTEEGVDHGQASDQVILVETDVVRAQISLRGGEIRRMELKDYPVSKDQPNTPIPLLGEGDGQFFIFQSGLAGTDSPVASSNTVYRATSRKFTLADGAKQLEVALEHRNAQGIKVRKLFRFARGSYRVVVEQLVENGTDAPLTVSPYARFKRNDVVLGTLPKFVATFLGVGFFEKKDGSDGYRFVKTKLDDLEDDAFDKRQKEGWIAMLQHYFVAAILPPENSEGVFSAKADKTNQKFSAQYVGSGISVAPGSTQSFPLGLYIGPKLQTGLDVEGHEGGFFKGDGLDNVATGLEYTVDYGILTPLCEPLFWLLSKFYKLTGNWGWSIILLTLVVKGAFYKLSEAQYRSMGKMKKFAPRIQEIKERYGDDRERMSKAMMDLYKKEGFNPLAGCWPLLVQFPVFISLYWVLLESVELRQADFALWINDLSAPDPYYVLPLLFGLSFYLQQKWSGATATMDPMQQKIMNIMPIMMTAFFTFFQAGLVLYWLVSNLIGMAQQLVINKKLAGEGPASKAKAT